MAIRRTLTAEDLLTLKLAGDAQISPDGTRIAYVLQEISPEKNEYKSAIWLAREGDLPVPFTGGAKDRAPRWSPDGRYLAFLSDRSGSTQIWLLPLSGGEARQLTRISGGVGDPVWSPDSKCLAFTASLTAEGIQPEAEECEETDPYKKYTKDVKVITRLLYKMDGVGFYDDRRSQICVAPITGGAPVQLTHGDYDHTDPTWTPDGLDLLCAANRREDADYHPWSADLWCVPRQGGALTRLTPENLELSAHGPSASPDGRYVAFLADSPAEQGYGLTGLYLLDRKDGAVRRLGADLDRCLGSDAATDLPAPASARLSWSPDSRWVYSLVSDAGQVHLVKVGVSTGAVVPITGGEKVLHAFSVTPDGRRAALAYATPTSPAEIYMARLDEARPEAKVSNCGAILQGGGVFEVPLSRHNADLLENVEIPVAERFRFQAAPGEPLVDGWVLRPADYTPGRQYPAVLEIHGGPMAMYTGAFFYEFQWLAAQGCAVIFANPRGSQGYGEAFCKCIMADWGKKDYADVMAAVEHAVQHFDFIDPDRLGVAGGSYGGFMVNWIISHTDRFKAAVTMRSVVNRWSAMGTSDTGYDRIGQFGTENWWEEQQMTPYLKQSPLLHASQINTPLLIEHQEGDLRCPIEQAEQLYAALKVQKKPVKFIRYPGEFHGMSRNGKPWHRVHRLKQITDWFGAFLKG